MEISTQLHALYLNRTNSTLLHALYLPPSILLSSPISRTVRAAATAEILSTTRRATISPAQLRADLAAALCALSALLGADNNGWFFGLPAPGMFDAQVFAYTHLILDEGLGWRDGWLAECVGGFENLVRHRARLLERCWGGGS
jgi:metaxin